MSLRELRFNVGGDQRDDQPYVQPDPRPDGTTLPPIPGTLGRETENGVFLPGATPANRMQVLCPENATGGSWTVYQNQTKRFRVILPPLDIQVQAEAGEPPQLPPEYHGDADKVALHYDWAADHAKERVTLSGRAWLVGGRPWNPLTYSLLWGLGAFMKGGAERSRLGQNARWMADRGADGVRSIYEVDWTAQPYGGLIRGTAQALAEYLEFLWEDCGLRCKVTAQAGAPSDRIKAIGDEILEAVEGREYAVMQLEGTNEQWASRADAIWLGRHLALSGIPTSVGWGTAPPAVVEAMSAEAWCPVETLHLERTNPASRRDRQCYDFAHLTRAGDNGEFAGHSSSVASETSPFHLALQREGGILMGAEHYCHHTGDMVYGVTFPGPTGQRYANIWEIPNIEAMCASIRNADQVLEHQGVANWTHTNNPIPLEVSSGQVEKQYYSISSAKDVLGILTGTAGPLTFKENQPMATYELRHPETGAAVDPKTANLEGYIVRGKLA